MRADQESRAITAYDELLNDLIAEAETCSPRALAALFAACAQGLEPAYREWRSLRAPTTPDVLAEAVARARDYAMTGEGGHDLPALLSLLEAGIPPGGSADTHSATAAQDCWICADTAIRLVVYPPFRPAPIVEYALEPVMQAVSERLLGVSEIGGDAAERGEGDAILRDPQARAAIAFIRSSLERLAGAAAPDAALVSELTEGARVLAP